MPYYFTITGLAMSTVSYEFGRVNLF